MKKKFLALVLAISMIPAPIASYAANNIKNASAINETISNSSVFNSSFPINESDLVEDLNKTKNKNTTQFFTALMSILTQKAEDLGTTNVNESFVNETILNNSSLINKTLLNSSATNFSSVNETILYNSTINPLVNETNFESIEANITEENITELLTLLESYKSNFSVLKILKPYVCATGVIGATWGGLNLISKLIYNFLFNMFNRINWGSYCPIFYHKKKFSPWCVRKLYKIYKKNF